jgi:hypothetical protein
MDQKKVGVIRSWNEARGFGIVRVGPASSLEKYFLHVSGIRSGSAIPVVGSAVYFEVSDQPVEDGKLPGAIRADIIDPELSAQAALAGRNVLAGDEGGTK